MFKLYTGPALGGFAPHAVLEEAGANFRLIPLDVDRGDTRTDAFKRLNPRAEVPVLELPDGVVMTESSAMVIYLADLLAPEILAPLPDASERPVYLRWMSFMVANIYASMRRYYYPARHTTDENGIEAVSESALVYLDTQFKIINEAIGDQSHLLDSGYSAADIYLTMLIHWHPDRTFMMAACSNVGRVCEHVKNRNALITINKFHRLW